MGVPATSITDDFAVKDTVKWWWSNNTNCTINAGRLSIMPKAAYWSVNLSERLDLTGSYVAIQLVQNTTAPTSSGGVTSEILLKLDTANLIRFVINGGGNGAVIECSLIIAGAETKTTFTYDTAVHKWFRMRENARQIFWETSVDGVTWTTRRTASAGALVITDLEYVLMSGFWTPTVAPTQAVLFDNFNLDPGKVNPKAKTLTNDWSAPDEVRWAGYAPGVIDVVDGGLKLTPTADYWPWLDTIGLWDLTDSYFAYEVVSNANLGLDSITTQIKADAGGGNYLAVTISGGVNGAVDFEESIAGTVTRTSVTLSPAHRWMRIREAAGTVTWETSADGATWVIRRSAAMAFTLTAVRFVIVAGFFAAETNPGATVLDNFNLNTGENIGTDAALDAALLTDDFSDPVASADRWYSEGFAVSGGRLIGTPTADYSVFESLSRYTLLTGLAAFSVRLVSNANAGNGSITSEFKVSVDTANGFGFVIPGGSSGDLVMVETVDGVKSQTVVAFNPVLHQWFRLRQATGTIFWEASRDGATWSVLRTKATTLNLASVVVGFATGFWGTEPSPGTVVFDDVNILNAKTASEIGWYYGTALRFGGVDAGTVVSKSYFPAADWLWNPIPASPLIDPMSATWAGYFAAEQPFMNLYEFGVTVVKPSQITGSTPRYSVSCLNSPEWGPNPFAGEAIPIPDGTLVSPGSDGHLCIIDAAGGKVYSMWQAEKVGGNWRCSWGGISTYSGDGIDYVGGAVATNFSRLSGLTFLNEVAAGEIPHALFISSSLAGPGFRYPAQKSDGSNIAGVASPIPEGARLQLNPAVNLAAISGITPAELAIGRAMQKFGCYVGDQGGARAALLAEFLGPPDPGPGWVGVGFEWDYFALTHLPWNQLRVLQSWNGT